MFVYHALLEADESGETAIPSRHLHVKFTDLTRQQSDTGHCQLETEFNVRASLYLVHTLYFVHLHALSLGHLCTL